jgi:transcriptional regulator with XRE-family HTH domain
MSNGVDGRMIIAKRLKQARERAGISSQKKLGLLAGIGESSASSRMNHYEQGANEPKLRDMTRMGDVVGIPAPYFYCEDDQLAHLILKFGTLDEAQKSQLLAFVDKL